MGMYKYRINVHSEGMSSDIDEFVECMELESLVWDDPEPAAQARRLLKRKYPNLNIDVQRMHRNIKREHAYEWLNYMAHCDPCGHASPEDCAECEYKEEQS